MGNRDSRSSSPLNGWALLGSACVFSAAALSVFAQTTGTVEGIVTDQSNTPLPGVTVELRSPSLQGSRAAVTAADGRYRFPAVPPGAYTVTAELASFGKVEKKARVTLDSTAQVNLSLFLSTTEEVTVTGEAPIVDSTSTTQGSNYSAKVIDKLPVGRNYADIVFTQPGVQADFGETQGRSLKISIYGSTSAENLFLIDGVNTTNVIYGIQGKDINTEFIQEVEVKTGGYQAEYGRNTGGVVNVVTKSGGNEFHGDVFGYFNDTGMRAEEVDEFATPEYSQAGDAQFGNNVLSKDVRQEWGADLGGFMIKDKVWFFGAYDRVQINQNLLALDVQNTGLLGTFGKEYPIGVTQNKYAGKVTLNLLPGTSLVGSVFSDAQTRLGALGTPFSDISTTYAGRQDVGGPDYGARLNQLFGSFGIFTFQYARHKDRYRTTPDGADRPAIYDFTISPTAASFTTAVAESNPAFPPGYGYVFGPARNNESVRQSYGGVFTAYAGNHEIKLGGDYQEDRTFGSTYITGSGQVSVLPCLQTGSFICDLSKAPFWLNADGETMQVFFGHDLLAAGSEGNYIVIDESLFDVPVKRYSAFLQDQWRVIPSLTLNVGIRYDTESFFGLDPITGPFEAFALTDQWSPRIGVVWDFVGDGTSKLYASAGRFHYSLPTDLNVRVFTANSGVTTYNYDIGSIPQDPDAPAGRNQLFQGGSASGEPIDAGMKAAYQDELTIGIEKALDPTLSLSLKGTYRTLGRTVEDRCDLDYTDPLSGGSSCALFNPGSDGVAASGGILSCNNSGNPTDPTAGECGFPGRPVGDAKRIFRGIELVARKQLSTILWAQASLLYSSLRGNYSGAVREATGQTDPGINADFDYYQFAFNDYGNLELDRPVQARIDAVYSAPFGLSAGLQFYVRSGLPISRYGFFNAYYPSELYLDPRGSAGRTPTDYDINLSASYNLNVGPVAITPMLYLFNLLNNQTVTAVSQTFNSNGGFVTDESSPFYGQPGVQPGTGACPAAAAAPCTDNPDYRKATIRNDARLFRAAIKVTF